MDLSRYDVSLERLIDTHLEWTLNIALDDADPHELDKPKPLVLSPFLASEAATIAAFLALFPGLGPDDCIIDIGSNLLTK